MLAAQSSPHPDPAPVRGHGPFPALAPRLTGREAELEQLRGLLERAPVVVVCGVAGVGKSALVRRASRTSNATVVWTELGRGPLASLIDDARRELGAAPTPLDDDPLGDLLARLERAGALWVVEDLHELAAELRPTLVGRPAAVLGRGRCVVTSRERLARDPTTAPHGELVLAGLARAEAGAMWRELSSLQEPRGQFEVAWQRSRGNPLLLRCHHAGFGDDDPIAEWVTALAPVELRIMAALALCHLALPITLLEALIDTPDGSQALQALIARMLIEVDASSCARIHDLFRDAVLREVAPDQIHALHGVLARALHASAIEPALRAREVARHLSALGRDDEAISHLIRRGTELDRFTAAEMHLRGLLPAARLGPAPPPDVDLGLMLAEAERVARAGALGLDFTPIVAELLHVRGEPERGVAMLEELLVRPDLSAGLRMRALNALGMILAGLGRTEAAERWLAPAMDRATDPRALATLCMVRAYCAWTAGRDVEAYELSRRGRSLARASSRSYRLSALIPALHGAIASQLDLADEADEATQQARSALERVGDPVIRSYVQYLMAFTMARRGRLREAEDALRELVVRARASGFSYGAVASSIALGWTLLLQGQTRRGRAALRDGEHAARAAGFLGLATQAMRLAADDPLCRLDAGPPMPGVGEASVRTRALEALRAAALGDRAAVAHLVAALDGDVDPFDRSCGLIAEALLELHRGDRRALGVAAEALRRARTVLREADRDDAVVDEIVTARAAVRAVTAGGVRLLPAPVDGDHAVVIDERSGELRHAGATLDLRRRPVLHRLLYALARRPGQRVSKDDLMWAAADRSYDPLVDDSGLKANVNHLRKWLTPAGFAIEFVDGGYRLLAPPDTVHLSWPAADLVAALSAAERATPCAS